MRILTWSLAGGVVALIAGLFVALRSPDQPAQPPGALHEPAGIARLAPPSPGRSRAEPATGVPEPAHTTASAARAAPTPSSPTQARDQLLERLRRSGRATEPWMNQVGDVLAAWRELAPQLAGRVTAGPIECHREGCSVELSYADRAAFDDGNASLPATKAFLDFPGWRHRLGVVTRENGSVAATWFFMRPDGPVAEKE